MKSYADLGGSNCIIFHPIIDNFFQICTSLKRRRETLLVGTMPILQLTQWDYVKNDKALKVQSVNNAGVRHDTIGLGLSSHTYITAALRTQNCL